MARASIPVNLVNPGQVFACMGFLEAADILTGNAVGVFDWSSGRVPRFWLQAEGRDNPFDVVLSFLTSANLQCLVPKGCLKTSAVMESKTLKAPKNHKQHTKIGDDRVSLVETFPAAEADPLALPVRLEHGGRHMNLTHWCDGSSRNSFKLFAGQQRSTVIAQQMLDSIRTLRNKYSDRIFDDPFGLLAPLGGSSFKFDPRKSWTGIDVGYSPDEQSHLVQASPIVELLAAVGLEHARPDEFKTRTVRYGVWGTPLPLVLARAALGGVSINVPMRVFRFMLDLAGKNKIVTFAHEETT